MKIPQTIPGLQSGKGTEAADTGRAKASGSPAPVRSAGSDSVKLSPLSTQLQSISSAVSGPEFDRAKVDQIKQAIADGTLAINPEVVADKILASVQEMLAKSAK